MRLLYVVLMFVTPLLAGIVAAFLQLAAYRLLRRSADATPSFPILFARGLLVVFLVAAVLALVLRLPNR